jgi:hypothetical protein
VRATLEANDTTNSSNIVSEVMDEKLGENDDQTLNHFSFEFDGNYNSTAAVL